MYIVRSPYQLSTTSLRAEGPCQCMSPTVNCQGQSLITESNPLRRGSYRYLTGTLGTIIRSQGNLAEPVPTGVTFPFPSTAATAVFEDAQFREEGFAPFGEMV